MVLFWKIAVNEQQLVISADFVFVFCIPDTSVDFNTVHVTNMAQFHNFVFGRLSQVSFPFDPRCRSMFTVPLLTTVCKTHSYSCLKLFNLLVVARILKDHVKIIHVSSAQNPVNRLKVNEFTLLSTSELSLRDF